MRWLPIDGNHGSRDVARRIRGEIERQTFDFVRFGDAVQRYGFFEIAYDLGSSPQDAVGNVGAERPGRDGVDQDVILREFGGRVPHEVDNRGLGRGIAVSADGFRAEPADRCGDDDAAGALPLHVHRSRLHRREHAGEVDVHDALKRFERNVRDLSGFGERAGSGRDAGVGKTRIEPPVLGDRRVDRRANGRQVGDIERQRLDAMAGRAQTRTLAFGAGAVDVAQNDARAVLSHHLGIGESESRGRAGNERDAIPDLKHRDC